jgi:hypothetical protein
MRPLRVAAALAVCDGNNGQAANGVGNDIRLLAREDIKSAPHVRAFTDFLAAQIHERRARLAGM